MPYRDQLAVLRERLQALRTEAQRRERRFTDRLRSLLPEDLSQRLEQLRQQAVRRDEKPDALINAVRALEEYLELLDEAVAAVPSLEAELAKRPDAAPELRPLGAASQLGSAARLSDADERAWARERANLIEWLGSTTWGAPIREDWYVGLRVSFRAHGAPFRLLHQRTLVPGVTAGRQISSESVISICTGVPRGAGPLRIVPEKLHHTLLLKPLGLTREVELGDHSFDGTFLVQAAPEMARALLPDRVRKGLLTVARVDVPELTVASGEALLVWRYGPTRPAVEGALTALAGIRAAPLPELLLRDE